jgi:hypothetical protein
MLGGCDGDGDGSGVSCLDLKCRYHLRGAASIPPSHAQKAKPTVDRAPAVQVHKGGPRLLRQLGGPDALRDLVGRDLDAEAGLLGGARQAGALDAVAPLGLFVGWLVWMLALVRAAACTECLSTCSVILFRPRMQLAACTRALRWRFDPLPLSARGAHFIRPRAKAISPKVTSAPKSTQSRRKGTWQPRVRGARMSFPASWSCGVGGRGGRRGCMQRWSVSKFDRSCMLELSNAAHMLTVCMAAVVPCACYAIIATQTLSLALRSRT